MTKIGVFVATHKPYEYSSDPAYFPIQVGKRSSQLNLKILGDDTGISISQKNPNYCELTALFWAWKNTNFDIYGLVHYRRYFKGTGWKKTASGKEISSWVKDADMVVARPRNYLFQNVRSHYAHAHHAADLIALRAAIVELHPEYINAFESVMKQKHLSLYNMFIANREAFDDYCKWLFSILEYCENCIPYQNYGPQQARVFGFLAERLLNVWVLGSHYTVVRKPVVSLEREPKLKKAATLILRNLGLISKAD